MTSCGGMGSSSSTSVLSDRSIIRNDAVRQLALIVRHSAVQFKCVFFFSVNMGLA